MAMRHLGGDLVFSIGVNSGEVMAKAVGAGGAITVIGDTVNVAARLEKAAGPGEVLCGRLTTELAGGRIVFRARQPILLKGKQEPVEVWEAVSLQPVGLEPSAAAPPLVGRDDELAFLLAQWRRVCRDRQPQVVVVCGDAGSGKTRVISELARAAESEGTVVRSTYPAYGAMGGASGRRRGDPPTGPGGRRRGDGPGPVARRGVGPVAAVDRPRRDAPGTAVGAGSAAPGEGDGPATADRDRRHAPQWRPDAEGARRAVGPPRQRRPAHGAGGTHRSRRMARCLPRRHHGAPGPLSRPDALALAGGFACGKPLADEAADFLVERAGGNPLYLRELVSMARAQGLLVDDGDEFRLERR